MRTLIRRAVVGIALALPVSAYFPPAPIASAADAKASVETVSPRMAKLIAEFQTYSAAMNAINPDRDYDRWSDAAEARIPALQDLVYEKPKTKADHFAKVAALAEFATEDSDFWIFEVLAKDAATLVQEAAK